MSNQDSGPRHTAPGIGRDYPLHETAAKLNDRLGLYLSPEQQRGLATGLLVGAALGAAILAWGVVESLREGG
ncbi:MAG: hypothetical protein WD766_09160 [Gemmatimonadota bacterium]